MNHVDVVFKGSMCAQQQQKKKRTLVEVNA
jgi:hypothetical protein